MRYKLVIDILAAAKEEISALLTSKDDEHHRLRLESAIQRQIDYISLITKTADLTPTERERPGPATTIAGEPIVRNEKLKPADLEPREERLQVLRAKIDMAYETFLQKDNKFILKEYEENVIRGVAKKAKMKVTREDPETITLEFIAEIKDNIRKMDNREAAIAAAKVLEEQKLIDEDDLHPDEEDTGDINPAPVSDLFDDLEPSDVSGPTDLDLSDDPFDSGEPNPGTDTPKIERPSQKNKNHKRG